MSADVTALEQESTAMVTEVQALAVTDAESYARAGGYLRTVATYIKRVGEVLDPIVDAAFKSHKIAVGQREALLRPAQGAKRILGERMAAWDAEQARARREAEAAARRAQEAAERAAREAAEAETRRLQAEAEDRRLAEAVALEQAGDLDGADRLIEAPIMAPTVVPAPVFAPAPVPATPPKVEGVSYRETWAAEVTDLALLVKAVAMGEQPITLLQANHPALNGLARSLRGAMHVPGVRAVPSRTAAVRA